MSLSDRPLRICLVSAAYRPYPSGVSEHVHHLAEGLRDLGQNVSILTTSYEREKGTKRVREKVEKPESGHSIPRSLNPSIPFSLPVTRFGRAVLIPMNRSYATLPVGLRMSGQVKRYLAKGSFDIVHCHGMFWPEISYWAIRHSRSVNLITFLTAGFKIHTSGAGLFRLVFKNQLARIHGRIAISRRAREAAEPYVTGEFRIIPCGIDLNRFKPRDKGIEGQRDKVTDTRSLDPSIPRSTGPAILFLGRLDARKGVEVLLRALPEVLRSVPNTRLTVAGRGPMERTARQLADRLGVAASVDFLGAVPQNDMPRLYADCDVYSAPGLGGETLGIVLLEAMASGAPVVASRIPGYDETIQDGVNGILTPPADPQTLSASLIKVLLDRSLRERLSAAGLARAREYAWPKVAQQTLDFYRELLSGKGSGVPGSRGSSQNH
ncbi:MAG: glycosyltransferase family 4 protein [candidate division WOR-3 bacterium]|nr:glycosyltransferase family 4 protein [candidate division WOR-3 bacterium]